MKLASALAVAAAALCTAPAAWSATTLLNVIDPTPGQQEYSLTFVATADLTMLSVGGYEVPSWTTFYNNVVELDGSTTNLLGSTWTLTPAAQGSDTYTDNDGTSVPSLVFGGVTTGYYDVYSQTFHTTVGETYVYSFDVNYSYASDGYFVSVQAVPEPANAALMLAGIGLMGAVVRRKAGAKAAANSAAA